MHRITLSLKKKGIKLSFFVLCSLFMSGNVFSQLNGNRDYLDVTYNNKENAILMEFAFLYNNFRANEDNAYLDWCDFEFSHDGLNYTKLMRCETDVQNNAIWSWVNMKDKLADAQLQFKGCYFPTNGSIWNDSASTQRVEVKNRGIAETSISLAYLQLKWFLNKTDKDVKYIRINGGWHVNGETDLRKFNEVYPVPDSKSLSSFKNDVNLSENKAIKVYSDADAIIIKGSELGESINVYTTSGLQVKSILTNNDIIKIKLPADQIYIVNTGQKSYKVVL